MPTVGGSAGSVFAIGHRRCETGQVPPPFPGAPEKGEGLARGLQQGMATTHPQVEEDVMNRFRFVREIAVPAAIVFCYAGLSAFSHYATVMLARTT